MKTIQFNFSQSNFPTTQLQVSNYDVVTTSHYSPDLHTPTLMVLLNKPQLYHGFMNGYRQPVARLHFQVLSFYAPHMHILQRALQEYFSPHSIHFKPIHSELDLMTCLGEAVCSLQKIADLPIFEPLQIDSVSNTDNQYVLWIPFLHENCFHQAMAFMLQFITHHMTSSSFTFNKALADELNDIITALKADAPKGINSLRLLTVAHQKEIPWVYLTKNIFQYGYGHLSRWLDSTFTDATSHLGTEIARDKCAALTLLQKAGLPIPTQHIVSNEADAIEYANQIGYPVVIKPHNLDGGKGVQARIMSEQQVKKAFVNARQFSNIVLLQKHILGKDYRLLVMHGQLIWAIERIPASVTGDGTSTIKELIQQINQLRAQNKNEQTRLLPVTLSDDMHDFLAEQGCDIDSILKTGITVFLSRIANISAGGIPVAVFDQVHPDNKRLVETAAKLLRLDLAGIDFIMPDISQSYLTTGGALIEVNAQPQLGMITAAHMYPQILDSLLPHKGRIPVIMVCNNVVDELFIQKLHSLLKNKYKNIGMALSDSVYINNEKIHRSASLFHAAEALLLNTQIDALIYYITRFDDIKYQGLPFDRAHCLFFLDAPISDSEPNDVEFNGIHTLFKACHGQPLLDENTLEYLAQFDALQKTNKVFTKARLLHDMEINLFHWLQNTDESSTMNSSEYNVAL